MSRHDNLDPETFRIHCAAPSNMTQGIYLEITDAAEPGLLELETDGDGQEWGHCLTLSAVDENRLLLLLMKRRAIRGMGSVNPDYWINEMCFAAMANGALSNVEPYEPCPLEPAYFALTPTQKRICNAVTTCAMELFRWVKNRLLYGEMTHRTTGIIESAARGLIGIAVDLGRAEDPKIKVPS